jgi:inward rectifier potassium channel
LIVSISGVDETTSQTMLSRFTYDHHMIRWGHRFVDLLHTGADGKSHMDYSRIHQTQAEV